MGMVESWGGGGPVPNAQSGIKVEYSSTQLFAMVVNNQSSRAV